MDQPFTAASHHDILLLLVQLSVLLLVARALGEIAQRLGQPTVVGEILAGIILGPSFLSSLVPFVGEWVIPHTEVQGYLLEVFSLLGVMFLLLITGLETDLALIRQQARSAVGVALGGLLLPLAMGFALGLLLPDSLLANPENRTVFALFMAIAMAISAIPVVAKVLMDLKLTRRDIGQTIIASAMIDDTVGWVLLSIVIGLASTGTLTLGGVFASMGSVLLFMGLSLTVGRFLIARLFNFVQNHVRVQFKMLSLMIFLMFVWGAIGQALNLEALLGAFVVGIVFSTLPRINPEEIHRLESFAIGVFAPIFFAIAGLKVRAQSLLQPELLVAAIAIIVVAVVSKMVGVYFGARWIGKRDHWTAIFFGAGLNARGSMGIIVASIGLSLNLINQDLFSLIVVMAVLTSLMAPAVMRYALNNITPEESELQRLRQEEMRSKSMIASVRRILMPVRARDDVSPAQMIEARIVGNLSHKSKVSLTLMSVTTEQSKGTTTSFLDRLATVFNTESVNKKVSVAEDVAREVLEEARNEYDLMILGASEGRSTSEVLFAPMVDYLIRSAPCPTLLVRGNDVAEDWSPKRILVPSNGSLAARTAAEVAFAISNGADSEVIILQVVEETVSDYHLDAGGVIVARQKQSANENVGQLRALGEMQGVNTTTRIEVGREPDTVIVRMAESLKVDLIVLGTALGSGTERLYLGPRVERILNNAPCPVVVVNS